MNLKIRRGASWPPKSPQLVLVETCKLNGVNLRIYLENLAQDLLLGEKPYTPERIQRVTEKLTG
ncbi:MAG: hypothetical protein A2Z20_12715 [Bdellovibrionales bacterium RBG_16_40_8]|nr:MAG: hypothetical protein A2Z20_12715 [Bdellovibrionales bacterium RBG_16_40_8]